jgi:uncharacterized protein YcaQ
MEQIEIRQARRLALYCAGLLKPEWQGLPKSARGGGASARQAALQVVNHFGYLQLDTVSIAGARSHALVLYSRLPGLDINLGETLLQAGEPLFEYWGHEACWLPLEWYPHFQFRRDEFQSHPWWGDLIREHPKVAANLRRRIQDEGPLRSIDMEGRGSRGWWDLKISKKVANALWSAGELAVLERKNFQRSFDLAERVIPQALRTRQLSEDEAIKALLKKALSTHGWASTRTLTQTWRLVNRGPQIRRLLQELVEAGEVLAGDLQQASGKPQAGWISPQHLELLPRLQRLRPNPEQAVLLSPFDPLLWDRARVEQLFNFHQILEIFKPAPQRRYGYYCLPVLAGEHLIARYDLKAHKKQGRLAVLGAHYEPTTEKFSAGGQKAVALKALGDYAQALGLRCK